MDAHAQLFPGVWGEGGSQYRHAPGPPPGPFTSPRSPDRRRAGIGSGGTVIGARARGRGATGLCKLARMDFARGSAAPPPNACPHCFAHARPPSPIRPQSPTPQLQARRTAAPARMAVVRRAAVVSLSPAFSGFAFLPPSSSFLILLPSPLFLPLSVRNNRTRPPSSRTCARSSPSSSALSSTRCARTRA